MLQIILPTLPPDQLLMAGIILTGVIVLGAVFIRRAMRHRKRIKNAATGVEESRIRDTGSFYELEPHRDPKENVYLLCYICKLGLPIVRGKQVVVRPSYHVLIRRVIQVIGNNEVTITAYVDNVLRAHFDEYRDVIASLYKEKSGDIFEKDA